MMRRVYHGVANTTSIANAAAIVSASGGCLVTSLRRESTGEHHSFKPGRLTLAFRSVFQALMPDVLRKRMATSMQAGLERVEDLEKQQMWLRRHGSPLRVMGLPDHCSMAEVRSRYRDLVLETHPDTAPPASTRATAPRRGPGREGVTAVATVADQRDLSEYHILQTAYKMAMDPNSLYHQNCSAPELYQELSASRPLLQRLNHKVTAFAILSYLLMAFVGIYISNIVFQQVCERGLEFFDPQFYEFMRGQEVEEERKRAAGEFVDVDPKRLAPTAIRKLAYPGRFIHGDEEGAEERAQKLDAAIAARR